ncbi:MAG: hypothetical protein H7228_07860 [Polaromonas sp.]|nr:hypothetical protein [Polaromonas sp.]
MSFLNQLKSQASALQDQQRSQVQNFEASTAQTEAAGMKAWYYLSDLARQLNIIEPAGAKFSIDGKTPWPAMKLTSFRADSRKKRLRDKEVYDYLAMGWNIVPQFGTPVGGTVSANFPPDLQRIEKRLSEGGVKHDRIELRHPEKNTLLAIKFDYITESRGSVKISADHENAKLVFRVSNANGFETINTDWPAAQVQTDMLDELAKMIVAQPNRFA